MNGNEAKAVVELSKAVEQMLVSLGEDIRRPGLAETPARVAKSMLEMTESLRTPPPKITTFDETSKDMVTILGLDYWSMCEHHLVPFYGRAHIGYIPNGKIGGLSKFGRSVEYFARRPQIQEKMTAQIATYLHEQLGAQGTIVLVEGTHLCMAMRGIKKENHRTFTSAIRGDIDKVEFFDILKVHRREQ